jgi:hypothetical protein
MFCLLISFCTVQRSGQKLCLAVKSFGQNPIKVLRQSRCLARAVTGRVSVSARNGRKETPGCDLLFSMLLDTDLFSPGASTIL